MNNRVCVYCSSSNTLDDKYYDDAKNLGELLALSNFNIVYGGSSLGLMYEIAKAAKYNGAKVYGVMPKKLHKFGVSSDECDEFILTNDMRDRKAKLDELSNSVIALAGGFGTLEEVSEMIVQKQLGYNNKPIVFLNTNGFYDNLLKFFKDIIDGSFANKSAKELYFVANTPEEVVKYLQNYEYKEVVRSKEEIYTTIPLKSNKN